MAAKFDPLSFGQLADALENYANGGKKPNGILSDCIAGIEKRVGNTPVEFLERCTAVERNAMRLAVEEASIVGAKIRSDPHLSSTVRQEKNGLKRVRSGRNPDIQQCIRFARKMQEHLPSS